MFAGVLAHHAHFYPRSPCGERPAIDVFLAVWAVISIHALLAESDAPPYNLMIHHAISIHALLAESDPPRVIRKPTAARFLSTLSLRRATARRASRQQPAGISIHALLAESDRRGASESIGTLHFYPRSPCGERLMDTLILADTMLFLSTLSLRRATYTIPETLVPRQFLSTLSLRRATPPVRDVIQWEGIFLSTLSLRRATAKVHKTVGHFCAYETNFMEIASSC